MPSNPSVSVVIANYNQRQLLTACLSSLSRQSFVDFETLVIDNGSRDGSAEAVREICPPVQLIALPENLGFCVANNIGIARSRSRYVALLNNDTEADPDWLGQLVQALERRSDLGFCASRMVLASQPDLADACGDFYTPEGITGKIGHLQPADRYPEPKEVFGASAGAAIYRRSMLEDIGLFDEDFFFIHEDTDLSFRAQLMGYKCLYVPSATVRHHVSATIGRQSDAAVYHAHRNLELVYFKNMPGPLLIRYLSLHILMVMLQFAGHALRGKAIPFLRAKADALRMLPIMLKKRGPIQESRRVSAGEIQGLLRKGWLFTRAAQKLRLGRYRSQPSHFGSRQ
jgi:hypothetical protein